MWSACNALGRLAAGAVREDDGATAIEYGLLAALIAVACIAAFQATGTSLAALYTTWSNAVLAAL
jgi:pilus assembly protein Flp/PilA